jgi:hypothetical protein
MDIPSPTIPHIRQSLDGLHLIANPSAGLDETTRLAPSSIFPTSTLFFGGVVVIVWLKVR